MQPNGTHRANRDHDVVVAIKKSDPQLLAYRAERNPIRKRRLADTLVRENQALVANLVRKFSRFAPDNIEFDDLLQAGYIAFLYTLDNINPAMTFSTYFAFRAWYETSKVIEKAPLIYHPRGSGMPFKVLKKIEAFETQHGRKPTAEELGVKPEQLAKWSSLPSVTSMDEETADGCSRWDAVGDDARNPEEQASDNEQQGVLQAGLKDTVLHALFVDELEPKQAATKLGLPLAWFEDTAEVSMKRVRRDLDG